eukprot:296233_1
MFSSLISFIGCFMCCFSRRNDYTSQALEDIVTHLPGIDDNTFSKYTMFGGYIDVYPPHNRSIFYIFFESLNNSKTDPIAYWTNGGPGSSGLVACFSENGPFRVFPNETTLYVHNYTWLNAMNIVWVEQPAGVGFSFSNVTSDYYTNDQKSAIDNYNFVRGFFNKFSNYKNNDFYITSASYGGHYMPLLAQQIVEGNKAGNDPQINLKGILVGNPKTDAIEQTKGKYDTLYGHQMVSQPLWEAYYKYCKDGTVDTNDCKTAKTNFNNAVGGNIDHYAIDYPVCHQNAYWSEKYLFFKNMKLSNPDEPIPELYQNMIEEQIKNPDIRYYINKNAKIFPSPTVEEYDPCIEKYLDGYLNEVSVQSAIHVKPKKWPDTQLHYNHTDDSTPMEPIWSWLVDNADLHLTIVSGDDDTVCATLGTQSWMYNMNWTAGDWKVWTDDDDQTGGYMIEFKTDKKTAMKLVTVHSAGHMIPQTQPSRSLQAVKRYLSGEF